METFPVDSRTRLLCLIGWPTEHSMSPIMHNATIQKMQLNYVYLAFNVTQDKLKGAIRGIKALDIKGINVTIPHKEKIMYFVDDVDPLAKKIGAVNTIKNVDGVLKAKNTDAAGSKKGLKDAGCEISGKNILILGAGGASRAVSFVLAEEANKIMISNRTKQRAVSLAEDIKKKTNIEVEAYSNEPSVLEKIIEDTHILINTTPIGMYPNINDLPLPENLIHKNLFVFDVIYNPLKTKLLKIAEKKGCEILGGLDMLINQGALAFQWWTGKDPDINLMKRAIINYLEKKDAR